MQFASPKHHLDQALGFGPGTCRRVKPQSSEPVKMVKGCKRVLTCAKHLRHLKALQTFVLHEGLRQGQPAFGCRCRSGRHDLGHFYALPKS